MFKIKIKEFKERITKKIKEKKKNKKIIPKKRYIIDFSTEFSVEFGSLESRSEVYDEQNEYHFIDLKYTDKKNDIIYDNKVWDMF